VDFLYICIMDDVKKEKIRYNLEVEKKLKPIFKDAINSNDLRGIENLIEFLNEVSPKYSIKLTSFLHQKVYEINDKGLNLKYPFKLTSEKKTFLKNIANEFKL
jgi:hypothetical protein